MFPKISIWSLFRDDAGENVARYRQQLAAVDYPPDLLRFYFVEGDSKDNTLGELRAWAVEDQRLTVVQHHTGATRMRHTPHPERLRCLAETGNAALDALAADRWGEWALLIESDLQFKPDILTKLLGHKPADAAIIAPYIWIATPSYWVQFYDVWAFRTLDTVIPQGDPQGLMFPAQTPTFFTARFPHQPFEVESVGSVALMEAGPIYDGVRYTADWAVRGICLQYRERGLKVYADPQAHVLHPFVAFPYEFIEQTKVNESEL